MNDKVAVHPAVEQAANAERAASARPALGFLEARNRLEEACEGIQSELVGQWLREVDPARRERCWHECRAVEAVRGKLVAQLSDDVQAIAETRDLTDDDLDDLRRVEALTESMWAPTWRRWLDAVRSWRNGR